jgi:hypothetical protein
MPNGCANQGKEQRWSASFGGLRTGWAIIKTLDSEAYFLFFFFSWGITT